MGGRQMTKMRFLPRDDAVGGGGAVRDGRRLRRRAHGGARGRRCSGDGDGEGMRAPRRVRRRDSGGGDEGSGAPLSATLEVEDGIRPTGEEWLLRGGEERTGLEISGDVCGRGEAPRAAIYRVRAATGLLEAQEGRAARQR